MYPFLAKELSEADCEAMIGLVIGIDFDAKSIRVGQNETISCEFCWVCAAVGEPTLGDCAVIDFECGVVMQCVKIFSHL